MFGCGGWGHGGRHLWHLVSPGYGFGPGYWGTLSPLGIPRGTGWLIRAALAEGPKTESEIRDYISKYTGYQIAYSLKPLLDIWVSRGLAKLRDDGKYELTSLAPWPIWWY